MHDNAIRCAAPTIEQLRPDKLLWVYKVPPSGLVMPEGAGSHLHLDEVEDLLLALGVRDLVQLLGQAAQHGPPAGLVDGGGGAGVRALVHDGVMAGDAQPIVQPAHRCVQQC